MTIHTRVARAQKPSLLLLILPLLSAMSLLQPAGAWGQDGFYQRTWENPQPLATGAARSVRSANPANATAHPSDSGVESSAALNQLLGAPTLAVPELATQRDNIPRENFPRDNLQGVQTQFNSTSTNNTQTNNTLSNNRLRSPASDDPGWNSGAVPTTRVSMGNGFESSAATIDSTRSPQAPLPSTPASGAPRFANLPQLPLPGANVGNLNHPTVTGRTGNSDTGQPSLQNPGSANSPLQRRGPAVADLDLPMATPTRFQPAIDSIEPSAETPSNGSDLLDQKIDRNASRRQSSASLMPEFNQTDLMIKTGIALAIVLALVAGCFWIFKRTAPQSMKGLPLETMEVLGNAPLTNRQHLRLVRLGNRLLLLAVSEGQSQTLTEVTDPDEVNHLLELCQGSKKASAQQSFRSLLSETERDRTSGFLGSQQDRILTQRESAEPRRRPASTHYYEA